MPELPEIETIRNDLHGLVAGKTIHEVKVLDRRLRCPVASDYSAYLKNKVIKTCGRHGKYLWLQLNKGRLLFHLGMSGRIYTDPEAAHRDKHNKVDYFLSDNIYLGFSDTRRFAFTMAAENNKIEQLLPEGIDPINEPLKGHDLARMFKNRKRNIKETISDQSIIAGIGNIYASESLFEAHIHPQSEAGSLNLEQCNELAKAIKKILKKAIRQKGSSISDFYYGRGQRGGYQNHFLVYDRAGQPCRSCNNKLTRIKIAGRSAYLCENCQPFIQ